VLIGKLSALATIGLFVLSLTPVARAGIYPITATSSSDFTVGYNSFLTYPSPTDTNFTASATFDNFTFSNVGTDTKVTFDFSLKNTSSNTNMPVITVMGFDVGSSVPNDLDPAMEGSTTSSLLSTFVGDADHPHNHMAYGIGDVDFCLAAGSNCDGGTVTNGVGAGASTSGLVTLYFAGINQTSVQFTNLFVKYQPNTSSEGGQGVTLTTTPEPSFYSFLLVGFGLILFSACRRRHA
jgi:hypothetical protein